MVSARKLGAVHGRIPFMCVAFKGIPSPDPPASASVSNQESHPTSARHSAHHSLVNADVAGGVAVTWSYESFPSPPLAGRPPPDRPRLSLIRAIHSRPATDRLDIQDYSVRLG